MRKIILFTLMALVGLMAFETANAQELIILKKNFYEIKPFFMEGHAGDMNWIEGYSLRGDITLDGRNIGTVTGEVTLLNPPLDMTQTYAESFGIFTNTVTKIGTFQVYAQVKSYASSNIATTGDGIVAWHGTIVNGSNQLQNLYGLSAGITHYNIFSEQGAGTELLQIP